jgi:predicted LPLAT superfamily acyltransferase
MPRLPDRNAERAYVVFRQFADCSEPSASGREAAVRAAVESYAALLEQYCRSDPYNWFNFYDFWHGAQVMPEKPTLAVPPTEARSGCPARGGDA